MNPYNCGPFHLYVMTRYRQVLAFPHNGTPEDGTGEDRRMESGVSGDVARASGPPLA